MNSPAKPTLRQRTTGAATGLFRRLTIGRVPKLFDAAFYRAQLPAVERLGLDPYLHYVWRGAALGHDPSADFDTAFYRRQSGATRLDPVRHYLRTGAAAGLDPNPGFSTQMYLIRYPDVGVAGINPLLHYRNDGRAEGRIATPSASQPEEWVAFAGVREAHRWAYPGEHGPRFALTLRRDVALAACPNPVPRLCLVLSLDGVEIDGLSQGFAQFDTAAADALTFAFDAQARPQPPRPTLILALEACFHGPGPEGEVLVRYAEARVWNLLLERPRLTLIRPAGCLSIRVG